VATQEDGIVLKMKIGVVSDIHCNAQALSTALERLAARVDEIFIAGDAVYEYRFSSEVVQMIRKGNFPYILGNHEMVLLSPAGERARSSPTVNADDLRFMAERPLRVDCRLGGRSITMVHASPWAPYDRYLNEDHPEWDRCVELDADILITGHTHVPMIKRVGRTLIVNPGSAGESREPGLSHLVSYAEIDLDSNEAEIFRIGNPLLGDLPTTLPDAS
jgi:putative phosphoesterase